MARQITLRGGLITVVDDEDYERLSAFVWYPCKGRHGSIYASRTKETGTRQMQRDILDPTGEAPRNRLVDHADGNTLNNQRHNLRWSTYSQSNANRRAFKNNKSGFRGVYFEPDRGAFTAMIKMGDGPKKRLGSFATAEEAAAAYNVAAIKLHGEFARLNVTPSGLALPPKRISRYGESLFSWLERRHAEVSAVREGRTWGQVAEVISAAGALTRTGKTPTAQDVRVAWVKLEKRGGVHGQH